MPQDEKQKWIDPGSSEMTYEKVWWLKQIIDCGVWADYDAAHSCYGLDEDKVVIEVQKIVHEAQRRVWEECRELVRSSSDDKERPTSFTCMDRAQYAEYLMQILDAKLKSLS